MGFCELTRVLCCMGSVLAAGHRKGGGLGENAVLLAAVPLLMTVKGDPTLQRAETWCCEGRRTNHAGSCSVQKLWARARSGQRHCLNRDKERNSGGLGNRK